MKLQLRVTAIVLTLALSAGIAVPVVSAQASESGQRNTTIGLGALSAVLLATQKNKLPGILAAAGTAYSYTRLDHSIRQRHKNRAAYSNGNYNRYGNNGNNSYAPPNTSYFHQTRNRSYGSDENDNGGRNRGWNKHDHSNRSDGHHDNGRHRGWYKHNHSDQSEGDD